MPRYVAFLRGISPMNAKMSELRSVFESAGFTDVKTILSSGNVVFDARSRSDASIARQAEGAMTRQLGRTFLTLVRSVSTLREIIDADPHAAFGLPTQAKRIVTFLREPPTAKLKLPIKADGARILAIRGREVFSAYIPRESDSAFMRLIEKTLGSEITTRTLDTVKKCAAA